MKKIKAQLKVSGALMLTTWLLLVLIPAFSARLGLDLYFSSFFLQNRIRNEAKLFTEIQHFTEDLDERSYLSYQLENFDRQNHFVDFSELPDSSTLEELQTSNADSIRVKLEQHLKIPILAIFASNIDSQNVSFSRNLQIVSKMGIPSKALLRRMFWLLNDQENSLPFQSKNFHRAFPAETDLNSQLLRKNYSVIFLQMLFGTIYPPIVEPGKIHETVAGKIGPTGNIFFYYSRSRMVNGDKKHNLGSYLAVFRLQDIPEKLISDFATNRSVFPEFKRKIGFSAIPLNQPDNFADIDLSRFYQLNDRYALKTLLPNVPMVRRVQQGTIFPRELSSFSEKTSLIEVSIANEILHHPFKCYERQVHFAILLLSMVITAFMMRLWLFGFSFNASVAMKVAFATIFCSFLPIIGLLSLSVVYQDFQNQVETESAHRFIETRAALIQKKLIEELDSYQKNTDQLVLCQH